MFRLTVLLCLGIFAAMLIAGQDHGQRRFGLMNVAVSVEAPVAVAAAVLPKPNKPVDVVEAAFAPEKPLMALPAEVAPKIVAQPKPAAIEKVAEAPVFYVAADTANVREGPGKDHAVIEKLSKGEAALVVVAGEGPEGWSLIRIEGDGVEGYIASRLLTQ